MLFFEHQKLIKIEESYYPKCRVGLRRMRWAVHVARIGERRSVYIVSVEKPEGKRRLGRRRCRWDDNIKMDLQGIGCGVMDWIELDQDRDRWRALVNAVMNLRCSIKCGGVS
jgi:hypothetical protein